jgi:pSer/pThr/pTyr-binding forkhead associated (FHA) protein
MKFFLEVKTGAQAGRRIEVERGRSVSVGRSRAAALFPEDPTMSGLHFEIVSDGENVGLRNHSQTNGTQVNGRSTNSVVVRPGDAIRAGGTLFVLLAVEDTSAADLLFQSWRFAGAAADWQVVESQGLRYKGQTAAPVTIMAIEEPLPRNHDLEKYVDIQLLLFSERLPQAKAVKQEIAVPGADAATALAVRTPLSDGRIALQKQIYVSAGEMVGVATATVLEGDSAAVHQAIDSVLKSAAFQPDKSAPKQGHPTQAIPPS